MKTCMTMLFALYATLCISAYADGIVKSSLGMSYANRNTMPALPYTTRVQYLESTGANWISTAIDGSKCYGMYLEIEDIATIGYSTFISSNTTDDFCVGSDNGRTMSSYIRIRKALTWANNIGSTKEFAIKDGLIIANGKQLGTYDNSLPLAQIADPIGLFARVSGVRASICRISHAQLYGIDDELLLDAVPVRVDGIGYMFDRVSNRLLENFGQEPFIIGPDIEEQDGSIDL